MRALIAVCTALLMMTVSQRGVGAPVSPVSFTSSETTAAREWLITYWAAQIKSSGRSCGLKAMDYPRWVGYPIVLCSVSDTDNAAPPTLTPATADVYAIRPAPDQLARWIIVACSDAGVKDLKLCAKVLSTVIRNASTDGMIPVDGIVPESHLGVGATNPGVYCPLFRDGVTVVTANWRTHLSSNHRCEPGENIGAPTLSALKYARPASTTREQYVAFGGTKVVAGVSWTDAIRQLIQEAWNSDRNVLISAKALALARMKCFADESEARSEKCQY